MVEAICAILQNQPLISDYIQKKSITIFTAILALMKQLGGIIAAFLAVRLVLDYGEMTGYFFTAGLNLVGVVYAFYAVVDRQTVEKNEDLEEEEAINKLSFKERVSKFTDLGISEIKKKPIIVLISLNFFFVRFKSFFFNVVTFLWI